MAEDCSCNVNQSTNGQLLDELWSLWEASESLQPEVRQNWKKPQLVTTADGYADIVPYLFHLCEDCQVRYLDRYGIDCLLDIDNGKMPARTCRLIGKIVEALIFDVAQPTDAENSEATITVVLRHKEGTWILAMSDEGVATADRRRLKRRIDLIKDSTCKLGAVSRTKTTRLGSAIAILFAVRREA